MELGDLVESALKTVGITQERVQRMLGRPCGCDDRKEKLNSLSRWARRVAAGKLDKATEYLHRILTDEEQT